MNAASKGFVAGFAKGVVVTAGAETGGVRIALGKGGTITGLVYGPDGKPKPNTAVIIQRVLKDFDLGGDFGQRARSDANGRFRVENLEPAAATLFSFYPEVLRCLGCGACTKACPQELDVRDYMAAAMRGDLASVAQKSFDCIMCGLCAARCPAEEAQYNVAILARRLYGRYLAPRSEHLAERLAELEEGKYNEAIQELMNMSEADLRERYNAREKE